jgi:bifunctional DNA-binding transcriptional regulator/antitoxin component of YhaV-PrlF toxin-antitoxin module
MSAEVLVETKLSTGYLTVVPKAVRELLEAHTGDIVQWRLRKSGVTIHIRKPMRVNEIVGMISHGGDAVASKKAIQGARPRVR